MARIQGDLKTRTFMFGKAILDVSDQLPNNVKGWTVGKQVIRTVVLVQVEALEGCK